MKKIILTIFYLFIFNSSAIALVEVDITRGNLDPLPIAVSPLYIESGSKEIKQDDGTIIKNIGEEISKVIEVNFRRSGLFNPLKKDSFFKGLNKPDLLKFISITFDISSPIFLIIFPSFCITSFEPDST